MNAKVGKQSDSPYIGQYSLHDVSNNNGERLSDFASSKNLVIISTICPHKKIHLQTWMSPDGKTKNQIDHVLINKRHASDILDVRSQRGADCDSDHFMVRIKYRARISMLQRFKGQKTQKYDVNKLKNIELAKEYRRTIEQQLDQQVSQNINLEQRWARIKGSIKLSAVEVLDVQSTQPRNHWFDEDCEEAINKRNESRLHMLQKKTRIATEIYKENRKEAKLICRQKKKLYEETLLDDMEEKFGRNESRKFFESIRKYKTGFQPRSNLCRDTNGNIEADEMQVLRIWTDYFQKLLNKQQTTELQEQRIYYGPEPNIQPPTNILVYEIIRKLKNNRAPGEDLINAELIKAGGKVLWEEIYKLIVDIWNMEIMPNDWNTAILCPIHKKGDKLICSNYRGISLLNVTYKIFTNILVKYITPYVEEVIGEYQCGFRNNRSTTDHIFTLRIIISKFKHTNHISVVSIETKFYEKSVHSVLQENTFI
mgnify:CR=1 FL=1